MKRREFLFGLGASSFALASSDFFRSAQAQNKVPEQTLKIQKATYVLHNKPTLGLTSLTPNGPPPAITAYQNQPIALNVLNATNDYTAMHWHGIRLPNAMDGVPYLTQAPIAPHENFLYSFTPQDAGTYWYHPHCMTMSQMASGLTGALIVKENDDPGFDGDQVINLKDFRLDEQDQLLTPYSLRGAARGGTFGNHMTTNWQQSPTYDFPSGGLVRLRLLNTDTTRIYKLHLSTLSGKVIAWDGHPIEIFIPMPTEQAPLVLGPGQRADIALNMPPNEGQSIQIFARKGGGKRTMANLRSVGQNTNRQLAEVKALKPNPINRPNLEKATFHEFIFGWSPDGTKPDNGFCGSFGKNFWSINRIGWPGDYAPGNQPLATLEQGKSYILRFRNESPNLHPIHLHGLVFKPIRSNKRQIPANWTDTVLLLKNEVIDVALVADNPGDWAFHCHVIEHQKTGLAGFLRVA